MTLLDDLAVELSEIPGFTISVGPGQLTFASSQPPTRTVTWSVSDRELKRYLARLRRTSRGSYREGRSPGSMVLVTLVQEALETYDGSVGKLCPVRGGMKVVDASE